MKTYGGVDDSSTFLDLGTRWRWVIGGWVGLRVDLDAVEKGKFLHCRESNPGRSPSLYPLSYPDSSPGIENHPATIPLSLLVQLPQ
jgi:hypothetical protein